MGLLGLQVFSVAVPQGVGTDIGGESLRACCR